MDYSGGSGGRSRATTNGTGANTERMSAMSAKYRDILRAAQESVDALDREVDVDNIPDLKGMDDVGTRPGAHSVAESSVAATALSRATTNGKSPARVSGRVLSPFNQQF
jgi:hypothetical protein